MSTEADASDGPGMVPSQWFVRILAVVLASLGIAALVGSRDDIVRYARMKRM